MGGMTQPVHSITDAPLKHSVEQRGRMVRYTVAMIIRIICFVLAAVVAIVWETAWALAFAAAAVVLPYIAVIDANAGGHRYTSERTGVDTPPRQLGVSHEEPEEEPHQWWEDEQEQGYEESVDSTVISGELAEEDSSEDDTAQPGPKHPGQEAA